MFGFCFVGVDFMQFSVWVGWHGIVFWVFGYLGWVLCAGVCFDFGCRFVWWFCDLVGVRLVWLVVRWVYGFLPIRGLWSCYNIVFLGWWCGLLLRGLSFGWWVMWLPIWFGWLV